jgi:hypothetical protein
MESLFSFADVLGYIFEHLESPFDLLQVAAVCKDFYLIARGDRCWHSHKQRILLQVPLLEPLFEKHRNKVKPIDGKRIRLKKRSNYIRNAWRVPKGIWFVFAKHLMFKDISQVLRRNSGNTYVIPAICSVAFTDTGTIVRRTHPNPYLKLHFHCCIQTRYFTFIWIAIEKGTPWMASVYSDKELLYTLNVSDLLLNFKRLIRNG